MTSREVDKDALYISFTRNGAGETFCTIVLPRAAKQVRVPLEDLPELGGYLVPSVYEVARRAAPALPDGPRVGIMTKVGDAPDHLVTGGDIHESDWDLASGRFFEDSSIPFEDLMMCVEHGEHQWRYHEFAGQDRCTRCQILKDGSYIL